MMDSAVIEDMRLYSQYRKWLAQGANRFTMSIASVGDEVVVQKTMNGSKGVHHEEVARFPRELFLEVRKIVEAFNG